MPPIASRFCIDRIAKDDVNAEYYKVVELIINKIKKRYPNGWNSIEPCLETYISGGNWYGLLRGLVQEGKSMAVTLLIWVLNVKYHWYTPYITRNDSGTRRDYINKLLFDVLVSRNGLIGEVCLEYDPNMTKKEIETFMLKPVIGKEFKITKDMAPARCVVPIYIMNAANHKGLLSYLQATRQQARHPVMVVADEIHELYIHTNDYIDSQFSSEQKELEKKGHSYGIKGLLLIHKLYNMCKDNDINMLGVTATPFRCLFCVPGITLDKLWTIHQTIPLPHMDYFGFSREIKALKDNVEVHTYHGESNMVDAIATIISRPHSILTNGNKEVKMVFITTEGQCLSQHVQLELIRQKYGSKVYAKLYIAEKTARNNEISRDDWCDTLDDFFNFAQIPDEVLADGVLVMITKNKAAASVSFKPQNGQPKFKNGYQIEGITDQFIDLDGAFESFLQRLRIFGMYDKNHSSHIWLESSEDEARRTVDEMRYMVFHDCEHIINKFSENGSIRDFKELNCSTRFKQIVTEASDPYDHSGRMGISYNIVTSRPDTGIELSTTVTDITITYSIKEYQQLKAASKKYKHMQSPIRKDIFGNNHDKKHVVYGDDQESRYDEIIKHVAQPGIEGQYQHNAYAYALDMSNDKYIRKVEFTKKWDKRPRLEDGVLKDYDGTEINPMFWWNIAPAGEPEQYMIVHKCRVHVHKHMEKFENWTVSADTTDFLGRIDDLIDNIIQKGFQSKKKQFRYVFYQLVKDKKDKETNYQTWLSAQINHFKDKYPVAFTSCQTIYEEAEYLDEEALSEIHALLKNFITETYNCPSWPQIKYPNQKIRPKLKASKAGLSTIINKIRPKLKAAQI